MVLSNSWQNITNKEIASLYFSETNLSDTDSTTLTIKFQLRDTPRTVTVIENTEIFLVKY